MEKFTSPPAQQRNYSLDALKSLSVLAIALFHGCWWSGISDIVPGNLYLFVDLLFIVTGYTTMLSLDTRECSTGNYSWYLTKSRVFRLWVPYAIIWGLTLLMYAVRRDAYPDFFKHTEFYSYFITLFLMQTIGFTDGGEILGNNAIGVSWPLAAEFWLSLVMFPLLHKFRKRRLCIIFSMAGLIYLSLNMIYASGSWEVSYFGRHMGDYVNCSLLNISVGTLRCIIGLALGVLVYYARQSIEKGIEARKDYTLRLSIIEITLCVLFFCVYWKLFYRDRNGVVFPFLAAVFVLMMTFETHKGIINRGLGSKHLKWFGKLYFGILMTHPFVWMIFKPYLQGENVKLVIVIYLLSVLLASAVFHITIERFGKFLNSKYQTQ